MKTVLACMACSILTSALTVWSLTANSGVLAGAKEALDEREVSPVEAVQPRLARLFDPEGLTPDEAVNVAVYEAVNRSVVNITSTAVRGGLILETHAEGAGSGAVLDQQGHILTNFHVVQDAKEVQVSLFNGKSYDATIVGADRLNDLAVVRIEAPTEDLYPVTLGDSGSLRVGMRVYAIGNPFGLERTLTTGIISSLNRSLQIRGNWTIKSIIQIDAAINPGSSGGPLLDAHGRLIGINTAIATTSGQSAGVGFAIPVSLISRVVEQLLTHGRVIRAETGILRVFQTEKGLLIAELRPNSPATKVGLHGPKIVKTRRGPFQVTREDRSAADLIVGVDNEKIEKVDDFLSYIETKRPGEQIVVTVVRNGKELQVPLQLSASEPPSNSE